jgi:hypothetical protein
MGVMPGSKATGRVRAIAEQETRKGDYISISRIAKTTRYFISPNKPAKNRDHHKSSYKIQTIRHGSHGCIEVINITCSRRNDPMERA